MEAEGSEMKEVRRREGERDESLGAERELLPPTLLVPLRRESEATGSRDKAISLSACSLAFVLDLAFNFEEEEKPCQDKRGRGWCLGGPRREVLVNGCRRIQGVKSTTDAG